MMRAVTTGTTQGVFACALVLRAAVLFLALGASGCELAPALAAGEPDDAVPSAPASAPKKEILVLNVTLTPALGREAERLGARRGLIIYGHEIDPRATGTVDMGLLARGIERVVPAGFDGFCTLDIEDPYFGQLKRPIGSPEFEHAQAEMLRALRGAKSLRPRAKWTIYAMPGLPYWLDEPGKKWPSPWTTASDEAKRKAKAVATSPARLLSELDWLSPSIYDFYPEATVPGAREHDRSYVEACVALSKSLARGRPVLPYVYHRYHDNGEPEKAPAYDMIPAEEFRETVRVALAAGADGVVWWSGDDYYSSLAHRPAPPGDPAAAKLGRRWGEIVDRGARTGQGTAAYVEECHLATLRLLAETVEAPPAPPP